jgi:uncharacterized protein GlcG (DUF336 family)
MMLGKIVSAVALACALTPANAELLTHKDLPLAVAKTIAETAVADCKARGYAVSVVVVDRAGDTLVAMRGDESSPHTMENARRKAYTARSFRQPTAAYAKRFADNDPLVRQHGDAAKRDCHRRRAADQGRQ